jgi:hypothetical protein
MKWNCEWIIFHQWHKTSNGISWIWTLFHQVNLIIHGNWMNHKGWNQIVNELYFIDDIKLLMTFHGSKLYFIKWISSSMEISSTKTCEWKIHVIFIHWKFTNDIQWMYEQFWNAWMNCNGIMGDQGEIKCWFNCWNSFQLNKKWAFSGWCANGCWFTLTHVVYGSKWTTTTPKTQQPNFFPLLVEF